MRLLSTLILAALSAVGAPLAAHAQLSAEAKAQKATLVGCQWQQIGRFTSLNPRALGIGRDGALLLAADDMTDPARSALVVVRQSSPGAAWELVDRYFPAGSSSSGARALHVDADGNVFVLGWEVSAERSRMVLRRSFGAGNVGTWESAETQWPMSDGGALASDPGGRIYVAYGFTGAGGIGWRVESALRGIGAFALEDEATFSGPYSAAVPQDFERGADGTLVVAGQIDGSPDEWIVRSRAGRGGARPVWRTIDRFQLTPNAYGLAPRAIVPTADGRLMVAGLGVRGGGQDDYQWLERWQNARGRWRTVAYQLSPGLTTVAQDAAATRSGIAVLGVGYTSSGGNLVLRESTDGGNRWYSALQLTGVTNPWSARLAVSAASAAVTASIQGAAVVLSCRY